jgi:signal transduction histidine kinase
MLALLAPALTFGPASAQAPPVRNVLTIHAGPIDYPANRVLDAAIRDALLSRPGYPIDYFSEYLEFDRFPEVETSQALGEYIARKYRGRRIDLVIAVTNRSVQFVLENRRTLFPDAAIVVASVGAAAAAAAAADPGSAVTGVRVGNNYRETLKLALALHPATNRVFVVAASPNRESVASVRAELLPFSTGVELTYIEATTRHALQAAVAEVPPGSLILYVWYQEEGVGYVMDPREPARLVAESARVPVYGVIDSNIGTGIVGGMVRDTRATGSRAGAIARRILAGTPPRHIPIEDAPLSPVFDWRQLQRWGLDAVRLPAGSDMRFRTPTAWESYSRYIIGALVVMSVQLLLIAALLMQRARRQRAERELRAREATLHAHHRRIRRLAGGLIKAQETVRAEIARDLHDDICQELVGLTMTISTLKRSSGSLADGRTQQALGQLERQAQDAVDGIRRLSHDLHPASLRLLGLAAALKGHCKEVEKRHAVLISFSAATELNDLPLDLAVCLFRIAQESLRNGIVHGSAKRLAVSLTRTAADVELCVADDGHGFDIEAARRDGGGLGLVSIEERAHAFGATAQIVTKPAHGTSIVVRVPIAAGASADDAIVPLPTGTRLNRAVHSLKSEMKRARTLVALSRRIRADLTHDRAAPTTAAIANGPQPERRP